MHGWIWCDDDDDGDVLAVVENFRLKSIRSITYTTDVCVCVCLCACGEEKRIEEKSTLWFVPVLPRLVGRAQLWGSG